MPAAIADLVIKGHGRFYLAAYEFHNAKGRELWRADFHNGNTTSGLTNFLSVYFNSGTQLTTWYIGLINNSPAPTLATADTIASHAGWTEYTGYSNANRVTYTPAAPAAASMTNAASPATFNFTEAVTIFGGFLVSNNTKGGTTGQMFATGGLSNLQTMANGQSLNVSYQYSLS